MRDEIIRYLYRSGWVRQSVEAVLVHRSRNKLLVVAA
jgi:hypothetical protein